jgi:hypothetical protein
MEKNNKNNHLTTGLVALQLPFVAWMLPAGCPSAAQKLPARCPQVAETMP